MDWPAGYDRIVLDQTDSTMSEAARRASGVTGPLWVQALQQTAARGRRGRAWSMPKGNFAATLILLPQEPPAQIALRSFVAALALRDALSDLTGKAELFLLKWPNDVLLNGGKVAGILLETLPGPGRAMRLGIGIGVNLAMAPQPSEVEADAFRPVSVLSETGVSISPEDFLTALAGAYAQREDSFRTYGFAPTREGWLASAARLGEVIRARTGTSDTTGTFETVDADGQLVLRTAGGRVTIPAADVFF